MEKVKTEAKKNKDQTDTLAAASKASLSALQGLSFNELKTHICSRINQAGRSEFDAGLGLIIYANREDMWSGDSFRGSVESDIGIHYRKAKYLLKITEMLCTYSFPEDAFHTVGWSKLKELVRVVDSDESAAEWYKRAQTMSLKELIALLSNKGEDPAQADPAQSDPVSVIKFHVHDDQKEVIFDAIDSAKIECNTEYAAVALEGICLAYLSGNAGEGVLKSAEAPNLIDVLKQSSKQQVFAAIEELWPELDIVIQG